jgi:hypothetical protein
VTKFMDNAALAWPVSAASALRDGVLNLPHIRTRVLAQLLAA